MKQILIENVEINGLKLIQVNDEFIVINKISPINTDEWCIELHNDESAAKVSFIDIKGKWYIRKMNMNCSINDPDCHKIIFATPNLKLEGVTEFEQDNVTVLKAETFVKEKLKMSSQAPGVLVGFIEGYKQAQQNLFTEEQVRNLSLSIIEFISHHEPDEFHDWFEKKIQSLKQPKVEITFENGKPIKCTML